MQNEYYLEDIRNMTEEIQQLKEEAEAKRIAEEEAKAEEAQKGGKKKRR